MDMIESDNAAVSSNKELENRIQALEKENRLLRKRLDEAGISYADIVEDNSEDSSTLYDPDQGARIKRFEVTDKVANEFFMMFCRYRAAGVLNSALTTRIIVDRLGYPSMSAHYMKVRVNY